MWYLESSNGVPVVGSAGNGSNKGSATERKLRSVIVDIFHSYHYLHHVGPCYTNTGIEWFTQTVYNLYCGIISTLSWMWNTYLFVSMSISKPISWISTFYVPNKRPMINLYSEWLTLSDYYILLIKYTQNDVVNDQTERMYTLSSPQTNLRFNTPSVV